MSADALRRSVCCGLALLSVAYLLRRLAEWGLVNSTPEVKWEPKPPPDRSWLTTETVREQRPKAFGRISSAEGGYVVRGARTGQYVPSRSSQVPSVAGKPRG